MASRLGISWVLSSISGYGVYGTQILLQYLRRGGAAQDFILTSRPTRTVLSPLTELKLAPAYALANKLADHSAKYPNELLSFKHPILHGCSSDFSGFAGQHLIWGAPNIACAAIEHLACTDLGRKVAGNYDMFIAISQWNADYLRSLDVGPVHLCYQGVDRSFFHPMTPSGLYKNRFVIFSGGKFEFRKGQDLVAAAFKRFYAAHSDALLVTCWQNLLLPEAAAFALAGHSQDVPQPAPEYGLEITPWLLRQGLPPQSFIDLPFLDNWVMPGVLRDCHLAVFPNRCEGGTNLVAMEAMSCGIPTYVSYNTGHKDLVDVIGCGALRNQQAVQAPVDMKTVADWGESDVDEIVAVMEKTYDDYAAHKQRALRCADTMAAWDWSDMNEKLLRIVCDGEKTA